MRIVYIDSHLSFGNNIGGSWDVMIHFTPSKKFNRDTKTIDVSININSYVTDDGIGVLTRMEKISFDLVTREIFRESDDI